MLALSGKTLFTDVCDLVKVTKNLPDIAPNVNSCRKNALRRRKTGTMYVVTAEQMREMDRRAIEEGGIPGVVLMENAGRAVFDVLNEKLGGVAGKRIAVFCGSGNNGGDGFVVARYLHLANANVEVIFVGQEEKLTPDAKVYYNLLRKINILLVAYKEWKALYSPYDAVVDAILGTGLKDAPRGDYADAIETLNSWGDHPVVAIDISSGVHSDTGQILGKAVFAHVTVTFGYPKLGHFLFPGAAYVGELYTNAIGWNWTAHESGSKIQWLYLSQVMPEITAKQRTCDSDRDVSIPYEFLKKRGQETNKGDYGHVGVVAGSRGMAGASALAARAAQRSGTGLVTVLAPACVQPTIAAKLDEQMTIPLPDADGSLTEEAFEAIQRFAQKATVLCVGPGLTTEPQTVTLIHRIIAEIDLPLVIDADGLNALAQNPDTIKKRTQSDAAPLVLTPHPGEAARLLGTTVDAVQSDRINAIREIAAKYGAYVVLKGRHSLTADPDGNVIINTTGNPGMATGGSGDTLTGILGGFLARYFAAKTSTPHPTHTLGTVALAVLMHGVAGDMAAQELGESALNAGDITAYLPAALKRLET